MHTMATRWQHCSTEKAAPPFPELGFQSHLLPRPSCQGTVAGGMKATTIPGVSKTLTPLTASASPVPHGKFCKATLGPG